MITTTRRERQRAATRDEIKGIARRQMAEAGAAALSLRQIAAEMGVTAPAIYRYFPSRDDLVTALIVDAYHRLADAAEAAAAAPADDLLGRVLAVTDAYRGWALAHPADYALILGTPIPGYHAPVEVTLPAARRGHRVFLRLLMASPAGSARTAVAHAGVGAGVRLPPAEPDDPDRDVPDEVVALSLAGWARMHGLVSLELFGHLDLIGGDPAAFYRAEMLDLAARAGLRPDAVPSAPNAEGGPPGATISA